MKKDETQEVGKNTEFVDDTVYISGNYLSSAAAMIAWQIIDRPKEIIPDTELEFNMLVTLLMRQHAPFAYSYFYQDAPAGEDIIPDDVMASILAFIRTQPGFETFLGKTASGIILPQ